MLNALTVDLEDWGQAVLDSRHPITDRVVINLYRLLDFLDRRQVRATFFALGRVAEKFPRLLPDVAAAGHQIATHGYGHELVYDLTSTQFEADLCRSIQIIREQTGLQPIGYRAPAFSITRQSQWAGPILTRHGIRYSSSIFPVRKKRYGIPNAPRFPHVWPNCALQEFPITTYYWAGRNWPTLGGGHTRLLPAAILRRTIRAVNRIHQPAIVYLHPYELAVGEAGWFRRQGFSMRLRRYITQSLWRSRVGPRISQLLSEFQFGPVEDVLGFERQEMPASSTPVHDQSASATKRDLLCGS
jgi:polysaccharide deacetylase family protein (PEP-CTERM system associated)